MLDWVSIWCVGAAAWAGMMVVSASAAKKEERPMVFAEFVAWTERFLKAADPAARAALEKEGDALAAKRRVVMTNLMQSVPKQALELAVPNSLRRQLPASVAQHLEQRVSGRGDLMVLVMDDFDRGKSETHRTVMLGGQTYRAFVYGRRADQTSLQNIPLHGIVLGDLMAVHESSFRMLEPGESVGPQTAVGNPDMRCPLCGQAASKDVAAEAAGKIYYFDQRACIDAATLK